MKLVETFEYGIIEYKKPSIPDGLLILCEIGATPENIQIQFSQEKQFQTIAKIIGAMGFLFTRVDCDFDGEKVTDYDGLTYRPEAFGLLVGIAGKVLSAITSGGGAKKKSSQTPSLSGEIQAPISN